jgi:tRNA(Ile)-lysidine synthase
MSLAERFASYIIEEGLFSKSDKLLLAVSGGIDSVVLCELCSQTGLDFAIAHCNFRLRGEESERDELFVRKLAAFYNKAILVKKFDTEAYAALNKLSIQVAARQLRYDWFNELLDTSRTVSADGRGFSFVLTAHHADDNIETMLMHFFRGTGIQGLRAMLPSQGKIRRPLLGFYKDELKAFAGRYSLEWVEDSSNDTDKYSRNYFRHEIIPSIKKIFPSAEQNLLANLSRFRETEILYDQAVATHKKRLLETTGNESRIAVLKLLKTVPLKTVLYEIVFDFNFTAQQVPEILSLLQSDSGKYISSPTHRIIRNRKWLIIAPLQQPEPSLVLIENSQDAASFPGGTLRFKTGTVESIRTEKYIAVLDAAHLRFPLILRKWKAGDYFYPLGMKKKKKLARFFIDQKLSQTEKERVWVLEMNKKIVWVIGLRIDDRFKVEDIKRPVLMITLEQ